jgi:hypothetical protein
MNYQPQPLSSSALEVPAEIVALTEKLARNAHDVWAQQRLADGWTYGTERNDQTRKHPCLVPYDDLPETEKEYDRSAAMNTIRAILALGYRIVGGSTQ